jgi:2-dehydropantoate 2-reductase
MRVLIVGAGALGTVVAAYLSRAGNDVTLLVKPQHKAAIGRDEVRVSGLLECSAHVRLVSDPAVLGAFDSLIVTVKGRDTAAALGPLGGLDVEMVLSLQNGVLKDDVLADVFGRERVLGALALISAQLQAPGVAQNTALTALYVGELDGQASDRCARLAAEIEAAGIHSDCVPDIVKREWEKLALYLGLGLPGAVTRLDSATLMGDPDLSRLCAQVAAEVAAVARLEGADVDADAAHRQATLNAYVQPIREAGLMHYISMTQDLMASRLTELDWTAGDVLVRAARHGVATPAIETCTTIIRGAERLQLAGGADPAPRP